jgi:hypothetical protein
MEEQKKELIKACKNGITFTVLRLLDEGTDPNVVDEVDISCIYIFI